MVQGELPHIEYLHISVVPPCTYITFKFGFERGNVVVGHRRKAWHEGPKTLGGRGIVRRRDGRQSPSPKVVLGKNNAGLAVGNALDIVTPPTGQLDGRFTTFDARVHGQDAVVTKVLGNEFGIFTEGVIVKGATRQGELVGLVDQGLNDFGMTMPLVDGRVCRQEIVILLAVDVKDFGVLAFAENNRQGMVVVGAVLVFEGNEAGRFVDQGRDRLRQGPGQDALALCEETTGHGLHHGGRKRSGEMY